MKANRSSRQAVCDPPLYGNLRCVIYLEYVPDVSVDEEPAKCTPLLGLFHNARYRFSCDQSRLTFRLGLPVELVQDILQLAVFSQEVKKVPLEVWPHSRRRDRLPSDTIRQFICTTTSLSEEGPCGVPANTIRRLISLSGVCSLWAIIIASSPNFWARALACAWDVQSFTRIRLVSGNTPFDLSTKLGLERCIVLLNFQHLNSVEILTEEDSPWNVDFTRQGPFHHLRTASIVRPVVDPSNPPLILRAPDLRDAVVDEGVVLEAPNLLSLTISCQNNGQTLASLTDLMKTSQKLETLHIDGLSCYGYQGWTRILHPVLPVATLRELRIHDGLCSASSLDGPVLALPRAELVQTCVPLRLHTPNARALSLLNFALIDVVATLASAPKVVELTVGSYDEYIHGIGYSELHRASPSDKLHLPALVSVGFSNELDAFTLRLLERLVAPALLSLQVRIDLPCYEYDDRHYAVLDRHAVSEQMRHLTELRGLFDQILVRGAVLDIRVHLKDYYECDVTFSATDERMNLAVHAHPGLHLIAEWSPEWWPNMNRNISEGAPEYRATLAHVLTAYATSKVVTLRQSLQLCDDRTEMFGRDSYILDPFTLPLACDEVLLRSNMRRMTSLSTLEITTMRSHEFTGLGLFRALRSGGNVDHVPLPSLRFICLYSLSELRSVRVARGLWWHDLEGCLSHRRLQFGAPKLDVRVKLAGNFCRCYNYQGSLSRLDRVRRIVNALSIECSSLIDSSCRFCL